MLIMRKGDTVSATGYPSLWEAPRVSPGTSSPLTGAAPFTWDPTHGQPAYGLVMQRFKFLATFVSTGDNFKSYSSFRASGGSAEASVAT